MSPSPATSAAGGPLPAAPVARRRRAPGAVLVAALLAALVMTLLVAPLSAYAGQLDPSPEPTTDASADPGTDAPGEDPATEEADFPLQVVLTSITPSTLPAPGSGGQVSVSGRLQNVSDIPYDAVKVYPALGTDPMTTSAELRTAAELPTTTVIGDRNLDPANFDDLGDLAPGAEASFGVTIGADDVGVTESGVYWLSVQALGGVAGGRDAVADGRARTFVVLEDGTSDSDPIGPQVSPRQVDLSMVLPLRRSAVRDAEGRLQSTARWDRQLAEDGRLSRIVGVGGQSGIDASWLVDPAVVDGATSLAQGDPAVPLTARELAALAGEPGFTTEPLDSDQDGDQDADPDSGGSDAPASPSPPDAEPGSSEAPAPSPDATSPSPSDQGGTDGTTGPLAPGADFARPDSAAAAWLSRLGTALPDDPDLVSLLPYADPDVSAIARTGARGLLREAVRATASAQQRLGVQGRLLVAPARGFLRPAAAVEDGPLASVVPLLLAPAAVAPTRDAGSGSGSGAGDLPAGGDLATASGHDVVLQDAGVASGGPVPGGDRSALAVRQRVLAEALVALLADSSGTARPRLVAVPPARWDPGPDWEEADLLGGLDVPWISTTPLPGAPLSSDEGSDTGTDPGSDVPSESADPASPDETPESPESPESPATSPSAEPEARTQVSSQLVGAEATTVRLRYPRRQATRELNQALVAAAADQVQLARALGAVLPDNPVAGDQLVRAALTNISWHVRGRELPAAQRIAGQAVTSLEVLRAIRLEVPSLVTMSSSSGSITVKIVNGLDQPVRVGLDATVSSTTGPGGLVIDVPDAIDIAAEQQTTLRLPARTGQVGVNVVELRAASPTGRAIGLPSEVNVRASTLGVVIYRLMAAVGFVLLAVVIFRVRRRIRVRRATHGPLLSQERR